MFKSETFEKKIANRNAVIDYQVACVLQALFKSVIPAKNGIDPNPDTDLCDQLEDLFKLQQLNFIEVIPVINALAKIAYKASLKETSVYNYKDFSAINGLYHDALLRLLDTHFVATKPRNRLSESFFSTDNLIYTVKDSSFNNLITPLVPQERGYLLDLTLFEQYNKTLLLIACGMTLGLVIAAMIGGFVFLMAINVLHGLPSMWWISGGIGLAVSLAYLSALALTPTPEMDKMLEVDYRTYPCQLTTQSQAQITTAELTQIAHLSLNPVNDCLKDPDVTESTLPNSPT